MSSPEVQLHHAYWLYEGQNQFDPDYLVRQSYAAFGDEINVAISTGLGATNVASIANHFVQAGLENFAVVHTVCPPHLERRALNNGVVEQAIIKGSLAVMRDINRRVGRPLDTPLTGAGESAGAGKWLIVASAHPEVVDDLILSAPLGVTNHYFGNESDARRKSMRHRQRAISKRAAELKLEPVEEYIVDGHPVDEPMSDGRAKRLADTAIAGMRFALARDDGPKLGRALYAMGLLDCLYVTPDDSLIRPDELRETFSDIEDFVRPFGKGNHPSLTTEAGCDYMAELIKEHMATKSDRELVAA